MAGKLSDDSVKRMVEHRMPQGVFAKGCVEMALYPDKYNGLTAAEAAQKVGEVLGRVVLKQQAIKMAKSTDNVKLIVRRPSKPRPQGKTPAGALVNNDRQRVAFQILAYQFEANGFELTRSFTLLCQGKSAADCHAQLQKEIKQGRE